MDSTKERVAFVVIISSEVGGQDQTGQVGVAEPAAARRASNWIGFMVSGE